MEDIFYNSFVEEWMPKQADIIADLEYNKNLMDHLVTTELMYGKMNGLINTGLINEEHIEKWQIVGFTILSLQHRIYNTIPDFPSKQRDQLLALSKEVIKDQRFHNDAYLNRGETLTEEKLLLKLKSFDVIISDAIITPDKTLKILLKNPQEATLFNTATKFARDVDAAGVKLKRIVLYDAAKATLVNDYAGGELFEKPL